MLQGSMTIMCVRIMKFKHVGRGVFNPRHTCKAKGYRNWFVSVCVSVCLRFFCHHILQAGQKWYQCTLALSFKSYGMKTKWKRHMQNYQSLTSTAVCLFAYHGDIRKCNGGHMSSLPMSKVLHTSLASPFQILARDHSSVAQPINYSGSDLHVCMGAMPLHTCF
jgi:hypothetical protein